MTNTWLFSTKTTIQDLQLLMFDKRMKFISPDGRDNDKITFSSSYYCYDTTKTNSDGELDVPVKRVLWVEFIISTYTRGIMNQLDQTIEDLKFCVETLGMNDEQVEEYLNITVSSV